MSVAVIGLGQMGGGIARCLDAAGVLAAAHDVNIEQLAGFSDRVAAASGQGLIDRAQVILCVVPSSGEVAEALAGCSGNGQLVVDMTTSDPAQGQALAKDLDARGFRYIDAAMTGGAAGADAGTLTLMIGGDQRDVERAKPTLCIISDKHFHLGPVGAGHTVKLIHNMILHASFMATCEGLTLAKRASLDPKAVVDVLNAGNARSFVTDTRFPRDILSGTMNARSTINNLQKDLGLAAGMAETLQGPAPYAALTHQLLTQATAQGDGGLDFSWLFEKFEDLAEGSRDDN